MLRRTTLLFGLLAVALAFVSVTLAARVTVRVEGKTQTIFGATEPRVEATNGLAALESASLAGEFYYYVQPTGFGPFVNQIGRYVSGPAGGWVFKVNGASPDVGADKVALKDGDRVLWYWAVFSGPVAQATLRLQRRSAGCYRVLSEDQAGKTRPATGATLRVDGRSVKTKGGAACVGKHTGLVRATLTGAIRSNALR